MDQLTILKSLQTKVQSHFQKDKRLLSFSEFLGLVTTHPESYLRGTAKYTRDMIDYFENEPAKSKSQKDTSKGGKTHEGEKIFKVFTSPPGARPVIGLELVQKQIYQSLTTFINQGQINKLILLHGPNGSAKSSIVQALMSGLETYSETPEGAQYSFSWVFPTERVTKAGFGLSANQKARDENYESYASLPDEELAARIPSELRDHPLLLVPMKDRFEVLKELLGESKARSIWETLPINLKVGDLSHRDHEIFQALLVSNQGDYKKVLRHIQVERFYYNRRYRKGLVTVEPQLHVDAHYQQLSLNRSLSALPNSLHNLNLFSVSGDLIDGARGVIEYSDLLKRPLDSFKYLLGACETGAVNIGPTMIRPDCLWIGSANELQLDAFKEFPDFTSFKARIELIRVPYLLSVSEERKIYQEDLSQLSVTKYVSPHTDWTIALWGVLTRLKKPNSIHYAPGVSTLVAQLSPLDKAKLLDEGEMPQQWNGEERKVFKVNLEKLKQEYTQHSSYEGRFGASARELKSVLYSAAQNSEYPCLSPLAVLRELEIFVQKTSEHEFLKLDIKDGYHDAAQFVQIVREEYLSRIDREVRECVGLYDSKQWEEFIKKYVHQISLILRKEMSKNPLTGKVEPPDLALVEEFEKIIEAPSTEIELTSFRNNVISQIGAWSLDHVNESVQYAKVFPEYWLKLEQHYYQGQKELLAKMSTALDTYNEASTSESSTLEEGLKLAKDTIKNMVNRYGYNEAGAKEVIGFLMKSRYH